MLGFTARPGVFSYVQSSPVNVYPMPSFSKADCLYVSSQDGSYRENPEYTGKARKGNVKDIDRQR